MSKRISICKAISNIIKDALDGTKYQSNISGNSSWRLKFWDEVNDFPSVYMSPGLERREYLPGNFTWCHFNVSLKLYCKGENSQDELEQLLQDVESVLEANRVLVYDITNNYVTTEIAVVSITTDEGLLAPYAVGELNIQVTFQKM